MGQLRNRFRSELQSFGTAVWYGRYDPGGSLDCNFTLSQETEDETMTGWNTSFPFADKGGTFSSTRYEHWASDLWLDVIPGFAGYQYHGPQFARYATLDSSANATPWGLTPPPSDLNLKGTAAIARCSPANPHASVLEAVGEIHRDGLPSLPGLKAFQGSTDPRLLADEYLNLEFGVKPLLSDIRSLCKSMKESERILSQYVRDGGRQVRRRYEFPIAVDTEVSDEIGTWYLPQPTMPSYCYGTTTGCHRQTVRSIERKTWFSGAFVYRPLIESSDVERLSATMRKANHLLGVIPSPSTIWNLMPWSWAVDWFANVGDLLTNISAFVNDGLVMRYGYIMDQTVVKTSVTNRGAYDAYGREIRCSQELTVTRKLRRQATPFGFGLLETDFTPRQWAILASIGISNGGRYAAK